MDNNVSGRFFRVDAEELEGGTFEAILKDIFSKSITERERNIGAEAGDAIICRLERLAEDGDFLDGELIRRQVDNKPPEANAEGLTPLALSEGGGLGHSSAFRYHRPTCTLCLQNNPLGLSAGRLRAYLFAWNPQSKFSIERVPTADAIARFAEGDSRSFEIEVASPLNLPAIEGADQGADKTVVEAARMLSAAFEGLTVTIQVSMGRSAGALPKGPIRSVLDRLIPWKKSGQADVRKLRVRSKEPEIDGEGETEVINFLEEFLQERERTDLPDDNPEQNYQIRRAFLTQWHSQHLPYLKQIYLE